MYVLAWEKTGLLLSLTLMIIAMTAEAQERKTGASSEDTANSVPYRAMADSISRTVHDDASDVLVGQLNKVFDGRWRFRIVEHRIHEDVVVVLGELSAGGGSRQQFGTAVLKGPGSIGEALTMAAQDALVQAAKFFDLRSDTTATATGAPPSRTVSDGLTPLTNAVPVVTSTASPLPSLAPEKWFDPATTKHVGTPMEPKVIDMKKVEFDRYMLEAVRITTPPKLDGYLDDPIWRQAPAAGGFRQRNPAEGFLDTEATEVRVLYDEKNLYFGVMCYDKNPARVVATEMRRDEIQDMNDDDIIELYIAPNGEKGDTYFFGTNPLGVRGDALVGSGLSSFNQDWDTNWQSYATRHSMGWSVEIVLPFKAFRFNPEERQDWSFNVGRFVQRTRAAAFWVPVSRADGFAGTVEYSKGGRIVGLEGIKPGRALELLPYTVMGTIGNRGATQRGEAINFDLRRDFGLDLKWGITSNITADATLNPDFAQIETDREVVNLSRFEFRFDERRPFFLEGTTIFSFGGGFFSPLPIFFSRRIGTQLLDGSTVQILHGEKVSGKIGGTSFGLLNVHTRETPWALTQSEVTTIADTTVTRTGGLRIANRDTLAVTRTLFTEPETNWNVFRLQRDLFGRSTLGVIGLMKEPEDRPDDHTELPGFRLSDTKYNRVIGADLRLQSIRTEHQLNLLVARSFLPKTELHSRVLANSDSTLLTQTALEWGGAIIHSWRNAWMRTTASYTDIRAGLFSDLGFITRRDIRQAEASIGMNHLIRKWGIRSIGSSSSGRGNLIGGTWITNHHGGFFDRDLVASWTVEANPSLEFENGVDFRLKWSRNFDRLDRETTIAGVAFPAGTYTFDDYAAEISTDRGKRISIEGSYTQGNFYDGMRRTIEAETTLKPMYRIRIGLNLTYNRLKRTQMPGAFWFDERWIPRFRFNYSFSPDMFISLFAQINTRRKTPTDHLEIKTLLSNFLFAYTMPQGHTFFLAYNQLTDDEYNPRGQRPLRPASQAIVAKFSYLFNL